MSREIEQHWNRVYSENIDEDAEHYVLAKHLSEKSHEAFRDHVYLASVEDLSPTASVLDAGCGSGLFCRMLADRGHDVVGFDFNEDLVRIANRRYPDLRIEQRDVYETGGLARTFDLVICAGVLQNVFEPERAMAQLASVQAPGGRLVVCATHARFVGALVTPLITRLFQDFQMPFRRYDASSLRRLAAGSGYELDRMGYLYLFPGLANLAAGPFNRWRWLNRLAWPLAVHCVARFVRVGAAPGAPGADGSE